MQKIEHKIDVILNKIKNIKLTTPVAIILGSLIISSGIVAYGFTKSSNFNPLILQPSFSGKPISEEKYIDGVNKKVFFVEYADSECPYCVQFHPTFEKIQKEYGDRIGIIYRYFPLEFHKNSVKEAEAIECAGFVGGKTEGTKKRFAYIKALFDYKIKNQTTLLPITGKEDLAKEVGLDVEAFSKCVNDGTFTKFVADSVNDGVEAGVNGTPTSFILIKDGENYKTISAPVNFAPYSTIKKLIDQALYVSNTISK